VLADTLHSLTRCDVVVGVTGMITVLLYSRLFISAQHHPTFVIATAVAVILLNCAVSATYTENPLQTVVYLTLGMTDRIDCPATAHPPSTLIVWSRNQLVMDTTSSGRLNVDDRGALVIDNVTADDSGQYTCTQYSPLKSRHLNFNLTVMVKGKYTVEQCAVFARASLVTNGTISKRK